MRNALAFSAFSCEIVPNSGSVLYPLLVSKDTERYFISPLWLWDSRALEAWHQADFFEFAGSWWVEESKRALGMWGFTTMNTGLSRAFPLQAFGRMSSR